MMSTKVTLSASLEDYLKAIHQIVAEKQAARGKDIAQRLGVSNPSVTAALRSLADKGLINYAPYDIVTLTDRGREISEDITGRHRALRDFFVKVLSVGDDVADKAACDMEHALPRDILVSLTEFIGFVERRPECLAQFRERQPPGKVDE
jgi:DtxR family Mn-dependent transcriptional regulator